MSILTSKVGSTERACKCAGPWGSVSTPQHAGTHCHSVCSHAHTSPRVPWPQGVHKPVSAAVRWPQEWGDLRECIPHPGTWPAGTHTRRYISQGRDGAEDSYWLSSGGLDRLDNGVHTP